MRIRILDKIKVGGLTWQTQEVPDDHFLLVGGYDGRAHYDKNIIVIKASLAEDRKQQIFLHELLHACDPHARADEQIVETISFNLYQVLVDNDFITKD